MKQQILINELNEKNEDVKQLKEDIENYLKNNELIEKLQECNKSILERLNNCAFDSIGIQEKNIRFTITKSKSVSKIDYDATLEGVDNVEEYKKEKISKVWNDDKIKEELNVIYKEEQTKPRITITELVKGE